MSENSNLEMLTNIDRGKVQHVIDMMTVNKMRVPPKFLALKDAGAYATVNCGELATVIYDKIYALFEASYQDGNLSLRDDAIYALVKIWQQLTDFSVTQKLNKFVATVEKIKIPPARRETRMYKDTVLNYINATMESASQLIVEGNANNQYLQDGIDMLQIIKSNVMAIVDDNSLQAEQLARAIVGVADDNQGIVHWRKQVGYNQLTRYSLECLSDANKKAEEWKNITDVTRRAIPKSKVKPQPIEIPMDKLDEESSLHRIVAEADSFFAQLNQKYDNVSKAIATLNEPKYATQQRLSEIDNEINTLTAQNENGFVDDATYVAKVTRLEDEEKLLNSRLAIQQASIDNTYNYQMQTLQLLEQYKILQLYYDAYKNYERTKLYEVFSEIEFYSFLAVIDGSPSAEQLMQASQQIQAVLIYAQETTQIIAANNSQLQSRLSNVLGTTKSKTQTTETTNISTQAEEIRKRRAARATANSGTKQPQQQSDNVVIPLNNNDN